MPRPYSLDLRQKAITLIDQGKEIKQVSELLNIAKNTIRNWLLLRDETNSLYPKEGYQRGHSHKITDIESFKKFAEEHVGETLEAMAQALGTASDTTVGRMMKKIGYTRKKRHLLIKNEVKKKDSNLF